MLAIMPNMLRAPSRFARGLALLSLIGLVVLGLAWELWLAPTGQRTLALKVLPLLLPLAGLWKQRLYTYRWTSLLVWLYFTEGAVRATSERGIVVALGASEVALSLALFAACLMQVRLHARTHKEIAA